VQAASLQPAARPVNPDALAELQASLLNLKAGVGRSRALLHSLQDKAAAYSDSDYVQHSQQYEAVLSRMDSLADAYRSQAVPLVLQLQALRDATARRVLFATSQEAVAALQQQGAARMAQLQAQRGPGWAAASGEARALRQHMQEALAWRYPPREHIVWRFKGRRRLYGYPAGGGGSAGGSDGGRPLWGHMSGLQQRRPRLRADVEQLPAPQQQQPAAAPAPPPLLAALPHA
jgi:hypothetical protein